MNNSDSTISSQSSLIPTEGKEQLHPSQSVATLVAKTQELRLTKESSWIINTQGETQSVSFTEWKSELQQVLLSIAIPTTTTSTDSPQPELSSQDMDLPRKSETESSSPETYTLEAPEAITND